MRGEKRFPFERLAVDEGSPPHARGKVSKFHSPNLAGGITPACAGKRHNALSNPFQFKDHPRMRGEKAHIQWKIGLPTGSPPHARGKGQH